MAFALLGNSSLQKWGIPVCNFGDFYSAGKTESLIGLYKTEVIRPRAPWRSLEAVEYATLEWVAWFNNRRLLGPIGYIPPVEFETEYYRTRETPAVSAGLK